MEANAQAGESHWRTLYEAAVLELDRSKLARRISEAESAIMDRVEDLNKCGGGAESAALMKALDLLRNLRKTEIDQ